MTFVSLASVTSIRLRPQCWIHPAWRDVCELPCPSSPNPQWKKKAKVLLVAQSCLTLCEPMDCSLPASSIQGILQAKILEWVAFFCSRGSSWPRDWTWVSWIAGRFYPIWATRKQWAFVVTRVEELGLWCSIWQPRLFWCHSELRDEDLVTSARLSAGHHSTLEHLSGQPVT